MRSDLIIVSTPCLHFLPGIFKAHEPVRVQTFRSELAVERFDERIVCRLARPGEVKHDALLIGPQIKVARDELGALIDPDRL